MRRPTDGGVRWEQYAVQHWHCMLHYKFHGKTSSAMEPHASGMTVQGQGEGNRQLMDYMLGDNSARSLSPPQDTLRLFLTLSPPEI